jgi:hypothetical protein
MEHVEEDVVIEKVKIDLNDSQKLELNKVQLDIDELELKKKYLLEQLSQYNNERDYLKKQLELINTENSIGISKSVDDVKQELRYSFIESTVNDSIDELTLTALASSAIVLLSSFKDIDDAVDIFCTRIQQKISFNSDIKSIVTDDMKSIVCLIPSQIPLDTEVQLYPMQNTVEFFKYLHMMEQSRNNSESIRMKLDKCESFIQICIERLNHEFQLLSNNVISSYADIEIFKRTISALTTLFKYSIHGSKVWTLFVQMGYLDLCIKIVSISDIDLGVLYRVTAFIQEITSCDISKEINVEKAKIFHRWFQTGRGIVCLIELLQFSIEVQFGTPPSSPQNFDSPRRNSFRSISTSMFSSNSGTRNVYYNIIYNVLSTLWNLSRSNILQTYIQNSISIQSYRSSLLKLPVTLSRAFQRIPESMIEHLNYTSVLQLQKLILKICSNICIEIPEYIQLTSELKLGRSAVESIGHMFFDSVFAFVTFANSPYLDPVEVNGVTCTLLYNISLPVPDTNKLIRNIKIMSFILKDNLLNKYFRERVIQFCNSELFGDTIFSSTFLNTLKDVETEEQMKLFGKSIVMNPDNFQMMKKVTSRCIDYLNRHGYPLPDISIVTRSPLRKPQVPFSPISSSPMKHPLGSRTPTGMNRTGIPRRKSLANWSPASVKSKPPTRVMSSNALIASAPRAKKRLSFGGL